MQSFTLKLLHVFTYMLHPHIEKKYRYYIRDNYYCRLLQLRYSIKDYINKKPYKIVQYHGEFQQELTFVLPYAYWHHCNGTLSKTISCKQTKPFYFFSESHEERFEMRDYMHYMFDFKIPNMTHSNAFSYKKWKQVPLKAYYKNDRFVFKKPLLIIANKYNIEWDEAPLNYLTIPTLNRIINTLKEQYQIVYNRPKAQHIVADNSEILELNEIDWLRKEHPEVILLSDIYDEHRETVQNFNHLQLLVYANCSKFISVHGGTAALASYFGGTNIIYSKSGLEHIFKEFETIFPALSGAKILLAKDEEVLFNTVENEFDIERKQVNYN